MTITESTNLGCVRLEVRCADELAVARSRHRHPAALAWWCGYPHGVISELPRKKRNPQVDWGFLLSQPDVRPKGFEPLTF
jgi:hypothetical protein